MVNPFVLAVFLHYGEKRKYSAVPNVKYFLRKCDICYASDIFRKRNAIYFHFREKMKMCG